MCADCKTEHAAIECWQTLTCIGNTAWNGPWQSAVAAGVLPQETPPLPWEARSFFSLSCHRVGDVPATPSHCNCVFNSDRVTCTARISLRFLPTQCLALLSPFLVQPVTYVRGRGREPREKVLACDIGRTQGQSRARC